MSHLTDPGYPYEKPLHSVGGKGEEERDSMLCLLLKKENSGSYDENRLKPSSKSNDSQLDHRVGDEEHYISGYILKTGSA